MFQESFPLIDKTCFLYGNPQPSHLLIQPVGAQDLSGGLEKEISCLKKMAGEDFLHCGLRDQKLESGALSLGSSACLGDRSFWKRCRRDSGFYPQRSPAGAETPLLSFLRASGNSGRLFPCGTFFPLGRLPDRCFLRHCRCLSLCLVSGLDGVCPFPTHPNRTHLSQPR